MAKIHGRLGAIKPAAATDGELFLAPANTKATGRVFVCNQGTSKTTFRLAMVDGAIASVAAEDYAFYDVDIESRQTLVLEVMTVSAGHSLLFRSASGDCNAIFNGVREDV